MPSELEIARGFSLPLNAITEVISVLATRGAGKSFGSADVIEELYAAELQFVVIDPMGVYWGLRSSRDGKKEGLSIIVLGGDEGDVPLEPTSGRLIADVVIDSGQSFVLDLSLFDSKAEQVRFMEAFCERLFYRKGPVENRTPLMLIVDEADEFAPQKPEKNETKMLSHMIRLAKRGRTRGIGLMCLTQRSAEFAKSILNLSSAVFFMRTTGPHDRREIKKWMAGSAPDLIALVDESFPKLDTGEALIYSPHWLKLEQPRAIKFREIRTFDSYKTPEPGEARVAPKRKAEIDLQALGAEIAATVERAKESDPAELRKQVRELQRQLAARPAETERVVEVTLPPVEKIVEVPVFTDEDRKLFEHIAKALEGIPEQMMPIREKLAELAAKASAAVVPQVRVPPPPPPPPRAPAPSPVRRAEPPRADPEANGKLPASEQRVLDAVAWFSALGVDAPTKQQVGIVAGYKVGKSIGGRYSNLLGALRNADGKYEWPSLIDYVGGGVALTEAGRTYANEQSLPHDNEAVHEQVFTRLDPSERKVLKAIIRYYPNPVSREQIAEETGYDPSGARGGRFSNLLGALRTLALIDYPQPGHVVALDVLFPVR